MPEGPEVKTVARTLALSLVDQELGDLWHSSKSLRRKVDYNALRRYENKRVDNVSCYGKMLFISIEKKPAILVQLGMTGQLLVTNKDAPVKMHTHLRWPLKRNNLELRYVDPRRFGLVDVCDENIKAESIGKLGPDPFSMTEKDFTRVIKAINRSKRAIKEIILDQSIIVGVGNIYASEALFLANIHPLRLGSSLSVEEGERLINAIIEVLKLAYKNSGTTFSNYVDGTGKKGDNLNFLKVFQKTGENCERCHNKIERIKQGGRSTFFCQRCQS